MSTNGHTDALPLENLQSFKLFHFKTRLMYAVPPQCPGSSHHTSAAPVSRRTPIGVTRSSLRLARTVLENSILTADLL